jgi:hypothetical protein
MNDILKFLKNLQQRWDINSLFNIAINEETHDSCLQLPSLEAVKRGISSRVLGFCEENMQSL